MIKRFHGSAAMRVWLSWDDLGMLRVPEERLSQLAQWVLEANQKGLIYGLELPDTRIDYGQGLAHREACLRALALHGDPHS